MWIFVPKAAKGKADSNTQQQPVLLTSGDVSIGRPLKKGSTVGKADVLIFNDQSVSTIHAKLHVQQAVQDGDTFQHGPLTLTDVSKFGTHLTRASSDGTGPAEQRLTVNQPMTLEAGDELKLGSHCRYIVCQAPLHICVPGDLTATQPQLQQQAAALNAHLCSTWASIHASLASADAAAAGAAAAAASGLSGSQHAAAQHATACHSMPQSCCVAVTGGPLLPSVLRALLEGRPLVTPAWLEAAAAQRFWLASLPPCQQYVPEWLQLPPAAAAAAGTPARRRGSGQHKQGAAAVEGRLVLVGDGANWQAPDSQLLSGFKLLFEQGCQADLLAVAAACGAHTEQLSQQVTPAQLASQQQQAAAEGLTVLLVQPTDWSSIFADQQPQQQQQQHGATSSIACVSEACVLLAAVHNTRQALQAAADAFAAQQQPLRTSPRKRQRQQNAAAVAAAAAAAAEAAGVDDGDETEADATEEGEDEQEQQQEENEPQQQQMQQQDTPAAAAAQTPALIHQQQQEQQRLVSGLLPVSPLSPAAPAASLGGPINTQGWHTHAHSNSASAKTATARTTGSKRTAAAAAATDDAEQQAPADAPSSSKRARKGGAAGKSPVKSPLPVTRKGRGRQQPASQQQSALRSGDGFGDLLPAGSTLAGQQQQQDQQLVADGCSEAVTAQLVCMPAAQQPHAATAAGAAVGGVGVNFKAFRRRGQQQQTQQGGGAAAVVAEISLVAADAAQAQGADVDAFLRDERLRQDRMCKADELFNATLKPTGKAPSGKAPASTAARARKK